MIRKLIATRDVKHVKPGANPWARKTTHSTPNAAPIRDQKNALDRRSRRMDRPKRAKSGFIEWRRTRRRPKAPWERFARRRLRACPPSEVTSRERLLPA